MARTLHCFLCPDFSEDLTSTDLAQYIPISKIDKFKLLTVLSPFLKYMYVCGYYTHTIPGVFKLINGITACYTLLHEATATAEYKLSPPIHLKGDAVSIAFHNKPTSKQIILNPKM